MKTIIRNACILDTQTMSISGERSLVIEGGVVTGSEQVSGQSADIEIDARGAYVLPGFIDGHVHFRLATLDFRKLARWSEVEFGIAMARLAGDTLHRGFTTVRDLGGDVDGLMRAIKSGMADGPRIIRAGRMLSQTGGHGDVDGDARPPPECGCSMRHTAFGIVCDGVDAVRKAARHNLRDGSDFLKIHVSGGVASPSDPLECVQYTSEEISAVTQEARNRKTYVAAHAYTPEAISLAVQNGVHTIEHGNLADERAAREMLQHGAVLVPTMATYEAMETFGERLGLPAANRAKNRIVLKAGLGSIETARRVGVTLGFGTDLIGETQDRQNLEFSIRREVESAEQILHAMYVVNAGLCRLEGKIGTLAEGAYGDVVISKVNPLENIAALADPVRTLTHVLQGGRIVRAP